MEIYYIKFTNELPNFLIPPTNSGLQLSTHKDRMNNETKDSRDNQFIIFFFLFQREDNHP